LRGGVVFKNGGGAVFPVGLSSIPACNTKKTKGRSPTNFPVYISEGEINSDSESEGEVTAAESGSVSEGEEGNERDGEAGASESVESSETEIQEAQPASFFLFLHIKKDKASVFPG
jgi:hypothetical protein